MMNLVWVFFILFAYIFSFFAGTTELVTESVFTSTKNAVDLVLSLLGMMCLWTGLLEVAEKSGITKKIERLLSPITRLIFPSLSDGSEEKRAIVMSITANLLGLSNAATPLGLAAMEKLNQKNLTPGVATDDMCMFVVINTASMTLIPTTLLTLRSVAGSAAPFEILIPVWICSFFSVASGIISAKYFAWREQKCR